MSTAQSTCPHGLKAKDLLQRKGYEVIDNTLTTREAIDQFKAEHNVTTTPQVFIDAKRIGGSDDLRRHLGLRVKDKSRKSYLPVAVVFAVAFCMAAAASYATLGGVFTERTLRWFVAFSMCILALLKLRDLESFTSMFLGYDLLAKRHLRYAYFYPFAEAGAGILMIAGALMWLAIPVMLFIGVVGAASVIKAVYIDKRDLKCACVGGNTNVPLGFISLTENLMMVAMPIWMLLN